MRRVRRGCRAAGSPLPPSASADATTDDSPSSAAAPADPLEGQWASGTVTPKQVSRNLKGAGLGDAARTVIADQGYPARFTLALSSGQYRLTTQDGSVIDTGTYAVQGRRLRLIAAETGHGPTLRWTRDGDSLDLVFVKSDGTPYKGIPDEAFARPLYDVPSYLAG
ncbi:MAG: hypothetical protein ACTHKG_03540 [Nocardioides sp.]